MQAVVDGRALGAPFAADFPLPVTSELGEPNDAPARATALGAFSAFGATGFFLVEGDVDWYSYEETVGRSLAVEAVSSPFDPTLAQNADLVLEVFDVKLGRVASADLTGQGGAESVTFDAPVGFYYIKVSNFNGAADERPVTVRVTAGPDPMFSTLRSVPMNTTPATGPGAIAVGDVTGDGRNDIVTATMGSASDGNKVVVLAQLPGGDFAATRYSPVQPSIRSLALVDVDVDGRLDVVVGGTAGLEVLRQNGTGGLTGGGSIPTAPSDVVFVHAVDIDADGDGDLIAVSASTITLLTHEAGGLFVASPIASETAYDLDTGDIDGDGRIDVVTSPGTFVVNAYHNTASGWTRTQHPPIGGPFGIEVADVTGDGIADILTTTGGNRPQASVNVFVQKVDGTLASPAVYDTFDLPEMIDTGDIDGDGRTDVVIGNSGYGPVSLLRQQPDGTLAPYQLFGANVAQHPRPQGLAVTDLDNDGKSDIIAAGDKTVGVVQHFNAIPVSTDAQEFVWWPTTPDLNTLVSLDGTSMIDFAVPLDPASVTAESVRVIDGMTGAAVPAGLVYDGALRRVTITPGAPLQDNKPYRIVVDGIRDSSGHPQPWARTSTFRTIDGPPTARAGFAVHGLPGAVRISWAPPGDLDQVIVRMAPGSTPPSSPTAGTAAYTGFESDVTVGGLTPGTTYSFAVFYKDRAGAISPARTATLVGTALSMEAVSSSTVFTTSVLTFRATLTRVNPAGPVAGQPVELQVTCRGRLRDEPIATATTSSTGAVAADTRQSLENCTYRWVLAGSSQFMGASSDAVQVTATIPVPPGGRPNRQRNWVE